MTLNKTRGITVPASRKVVNIIKPICHCIKKIQIVITQTTTNPLIQGIKARNQIS